MKTETIFIFY